MLTRSLGSLAIAAACAARIVVAQPCQPAWSDRFQYPGVNGIINDSVVYDDGSGPTLFVAGNFTAIDTRPMLSVAKLVGSRFVPVGGGLKLLTQAVSPTNDPAGRVLDMTVFDPDGPGPGRPELIVAGEFRRALNPDGTTVSLRNLARWDGTRWESLDFGAGYAGQPPNPFRPERVVTLAVSSVGGEEHLYVGGRFDAVGGGAIPAPQLARWNAVSGWSAIGSAGGDVLAITVHDGDGDGPMPSRLIIGSEAYPPPGIFEFDGSAITAFAGPTPSDVYALTSWDEDGGGPNPPVLYAASQRWFELVSFPTDPDRAARFARFRNGAWEAVPIPLGGTLNRLEPVVEPDGRRALYIGGLFFTHPPGSSCCPKQYSAILRWDGTDYSTLGTGLDVTTEGEAGVSGSVGGITATTFNGQPVLFVTGGFEGAGGGMARGIAVWNFGSWIDRLGGRSNGVIFGGRLQALDPDGTGPQRTRLFAVGNFTAGPGFGFANGRFHTSPSAVFDPSSLTWSALRPPGQSVASDYGLSSGAKVFLFDNQLHGLFFTGIDVLRMARLEGSTWQPVSPPDALSGAWADVAVFDADGVGPQPAVIYACGSLNGYPLDPPGPQVSNVVRWSGTAWESVGVNLASPSLFQWQVNALAVFDDGAGPALFCGGTFQCDPTPGSTHNVAKLVGDTWIPVGGGIPNARVDALVVHDDDGSGPGPAHLYAGGFIRTALGAPGDGVVRLTAGAWTPLSSGLTTPAGNAWVAGMIGVADTAGPGLIVTGWFSHAGGAAVRNIARWTGSSWTDVGAGVSAALGAPTAFDDDANAGTPPALFASVAAGFAGPENVQTVGLARFGCTPVFCPADFNGSGAVTVQDIFDFLAAYFTQSPAADINASGSITVQDIFDYLARYFQGCL